MYTVAVSVFLYNYCINIQMCMLTGVELVSAEIVFNSIYFTFRFQHHSKTIHAGKLNEQKSTEGNGNLQMCFYILQCVSFYLHAVRLYCGLDRHG